MYEQVKENIRNTKSRNELSKNSKDIKTKKMEMHRLKRKIFFVCFVYIKWLTLVLKQLLRTAFIK